VLALGKTGEVEGDYRGEFMRFLSWPLAGEEKRALAGQLLAKHECETV
jgi:hypothetical protein